MNSCPSVSGIKQNKTPEKQELMNTKHGNYWRRQVGGLVCLACLTIPSHAREPSSWNHLLHQTNLVAVQSNSALSQLAAGLRQGGYETAGRGYVSFDDWYRARLPNLNATWLTQLTPQGGLLWGLSTGESGQKYRIAPSLTLGWMQHHQLSANSVVSWRMSTVVGGAMRERPCVADYGSIGGIQTVNCRLAATPLSPQETLQYLVKRAPAERFAFSLRLTHYF